MKRLLLAAGLVASLAASAQLKEGKVVYERTVQLPTRAFGPGGEDLSRQMPRTRTDQFELLFGNNQSLWQFLPNAADEGNSTFSPAPGMFIRMAGLNDVVYHHFADARRVEQREVMDRSFVVTDSIRKLSWKLTEETKPILNYTARKAVAQRISTRMNMTMENGAMKRQEVPDTAAIVAWFTTDIPVPAGPDFGGQLPGLILELDISNGRQVFKAVEVSTKVNTAKIREPRDGKKVTEAEFRQEREKLLEEMRRNAPAGSTIRIGG